jgi:hypothetical protein
MLETTTSSGFPSASALTQTDQTRRMAGSGRRHIKTTNSHREVCQFTQKLCVLVHALVRSDGLLLISGSGVRVSDGGLESLSYLKVLVAGKR